MTIRSRTSLWLVAAALASVEGRALAQDVPLYRDPSPTEGPRIEGPLLAPLPPRPGPTPPPPPGGLGPFQPSNPGLASPSLEVPSDPLLGIPPMPPPLPVMPMPPMTAGDDGQFKRKTTIRPPHGPLGRCHEWFQAAFFGNHKPQPAAPKWGLFGWLSHASDSEGDAHPRRFNWPTWPLSDSH